MREAVNQGVADTNAYKDALRGLSSVADYAGVSQGAIEEATAKVTNEFFNAEAAATSLKNLLLRGFSLDQAVNTIQRLQDSAAYGRQASLTLSDAVKSATEGLKNENSILVDNAGVTKNVAKMWEEYAKQRGISTAAMTQAQRVEAEYLGIQQETAAMTGDLASLQDTLSGKMAKAENQAYLLSKAFGEANTQLKAAETDLKNGLLQGLTELVQTLPGVTAGAATATGAFVGMTAAVPVLKKVVELWKSLQVTIKTAKVSMGTLGWVALGLGAVTTAFTAYKNHLEKVAQEEEKRIQQNKDAVKAQKDRIDQLEDLIDRYVELQRKQTITYDEAVELTSVESELETQYGLTKDALDGLVASTGDYATELNDVIDAVTGADMITALEQQAADSKKIAQDAMREPLETVLAYKSTYSIDYQNWLENGSSFNENLDRDMKANQEALTAAMEYYVAWVNDELAVYAETAGGAWNDTVAAALADTLVPKIDPTQFDTLDGFYRFMDSMVENIDKVASSSTVNEAMTALQAFNDKIAMNLMPSEEEMSAVNDAWNDLLGVDGPLYWCLEDLVDVGALTEEAAKSIRTSLAKTADPLGLATASYEEASTKIREFIEAAKDAAWEMGATADAASSSNDFRSAARQSYDELLESVQAYQEELADHAKEAEAIAIWQRLAGELEELTKGSDEYTAKLREMQQAALDLNLSFDGTEAGLDYTNKDVEAKADELIDASETYAETRAGTDGRRPGINEPWPWGFNKRCYYKPHRTVPRTWCKQRGNPGA